MKARRFEQSLADLFHQSSGGGTLIPLALAERAGLSGHVHDWLRQQSGREPHNLLRFGWFGKKSVKDIASFWQVLRAGNPCLIRDAARALLSEDADRSTVSLAFNSLIAPLAILERGDAVSALHKELDPALADDFAEAAAIELGSCGDWKHALAILDRAHQGGATPHINVSNESLLWKFAYLQGHIETVLPRLAAIAFHGTSTAAEMRAWRLVTCQIRAGSDDVHVPVLGHDQQSDGYVEAAATKVVALEGRPFGAETAAALRRALEPKTVTIQHVDRGPFFELTSLPHEFFKAEVRIAARRKDYRKLADLATMPSHNPLVFAPDLVIDSLLEEGDWRAAAETARQYDPRDRPVLDGFDDTRMNDYLFLQQLLAAAAARSGDDAAAGRFLSDYLEGLSSAQQERGQDSDEFEEAGENKAAGLWPATLLAAAAEGVLSRQHLAMLLPVFRFAY
jgi:hypothetical protein